MREKKIIFFLMVIVILSMFPVTRAYAEEKKNLHEENFSADHHLKGLFASCEEYFQAGEWDIDEVQLTLFYTATTLVREDVSDFTVSLNGEPVYSQKLPLTAGETQKLTITLPKRLIKEGANSIRIESYIRTNEDDPCADDISGASWMVIRKDSYVAVSYEPAKICKNVADVYEQLTSIEGLENDESAVFLPINPSENELTAAAFLLSGIASNAVLDYENLKLVQTKSMNEIAAFNYGVYIGEYDKLPAEINSLLSDDQKEAAQNGASISFVQPGEGQNLLIVTGKEGAALENACRLFGNKESMAQTKAVWRRVLPSENVNMPEEQETTAFLSQTGSYVSGPFEQTASFAIPMSANRSIAAGSEVVLHLRYAQNLDFDRSLVTVYIEDEPIGSKKLEKENANADTVRLHIPDNLNITGSFQLRVVFDLEMKDLVCDIRRQDMPWAFVTEESTISMKTNEVPWLLFDFYPGPFIYEGKLNDVVFILPVEESAEDIEAMRKMLLTFGRYLTNNSGNIKIRRTDNMGDLTSANVISIGKLEENPIVQQVNNQLYFRFSPEGTTIRSNERMKIEPNYGAVLGTAQLLYSPYSADKYALLIVSGVTDEGMLHAADYLGEVPKNWETYGDGYVTDGEIINCYRFGADNAKSNTLLGNLTKQSSTILLLVTGISVLILMGISLILIWNKHRRDKS